MRFLKALFAAGAMLAPTIGAAQDYPSQAVTMVIPFSPGGSNDLLGRYLSDQLSEKWNQTIIVENKPGAGAAVGANYVVQSKPDGYTLLFVSGTLTTTGATRRNLPFDPATDLQPVGIGALGSWVIVAGPRLKVNSLQDLATAAQNETVFYGTTGIGSSTQLTAEIFAKTAKIKMEPVHYKGGTDALVDLAGGRIDVYAGTVTQVRATLEAGKAKALAVAGRERSSALPDVPTVAEAGFPGAESEIWWGVFAPAGTPIDIVEKINADINDAMNTEEAAAFLEKQGASPARMSVQEFSEHVHSELARWKEIATDLNLFTE